MKTMVVVPTYNEAQNLPLLIGQILSLDIPELKVLVIDDNSPDGTGGIAEALVAKYPEKLEVIHRQRKLGLGTAYVTGFSRALEEGMDFVIQMDADFSHPPEAIRRFLQQRDAYQVIVGSRYVSGGRLDPQWKLWRRWLSWAANIYIKVVAGLKVQDTTAGFKGFSREVLQGLDWKAMKSKGFAFQTEVAYVCQQKGFRVKEVPISFQERARGKSKMSGKIAWEALWLPWRLRLSGRRDK